MKNNLLQLLVLIFSTSLFFSCSSDSTPTPTTTSKYQTIDENITWEQSKEHLVDGLLYVKNGVTLTIEAGTVIKFKKNPTNGDASSALIIARGAKIMAVGTQSAPIIFTAEADDPKTAGEELSKTSVGEWAGLIILGSAPVIKKGVKDLNIEGISSDVELAKYGGTNAIDNSGILKYVSIRYTGIALNGETGNEIQGLTLGGVGSATTIDYVDIYVSGDDGIEIFGGTVNIKHISVSFAKDDAFDFDQGYRGNAQFLFSLMDDRADGADNAGEWDGAGNATDSPFSAPNVSNWTAIGAGNAAGKDQALTLREWFAGKLLNSVFEGFKSKAIRVEDISGDEDAYAYITTPRDNYQIEFKNNTFADFGGYVTADGVSSLAKAYSQDTAHTAVATETATELGANDNDYETDGAIVSISRTKNAMLDPKLKTAAAAKTPTSPFPTGLETVTYRGAFAPSGDVWLKGWSALDKFGYLK